MNIAVIVNANGKVSGFDEIGLVKIYQKNDQKWIVIKSMDYKPDSFTDPAVIRNALKDICEWLDDCKVFVAKKIIGFCYTVFESYQISMWEMTGEPEDFLSYIHESEEAELNTHEEPPEIPEPIEQAPGKLYFDLKEIMNKPNAPSSKQILLPFLNEKSFREFDIICDHLPRWFEKELPFMNMTFSTQKYRDCIKVTIKHEA